MGALLIGGCCGTEPKHIKKVKEILKASPYEYLKYKQSNSLNRENKKPKRRRRNKIDTKKVWYCHTPRTLQGHPSIH